MGEEQTLWKGSPSQVTQLGIYLLCGVTFWLVVPLKIASGSMEMRGRLVLT